MSVQPIKDPVTGRRVGFQARAHVAQGRRLTAYAAVAAHGGVRAAKAVAAAHDARLQRQAARLRRLVVWQP